jgi:hypothetical protein
MNLATEMGERSGVRQFQAGFAHDNPVGRAVNEVVVRMSILGQDPILLGLRLEKLDEKGVILSAAGGERWLDAADAIARYAVVATEHIRSRLPGYPILRVPHVIDGSPHVYDNPFLFAGFPWFPELRAAGFQMAPVPPDQGLGEGPSTAGTLVDLRDALAQSEPWKLFAERAAALTPDARSELTAVRRRFAESVNEDALMAQAGLLGQHAYKRAMLAEAIESSSGDAHQYLAAFSSVNEAIDMAMAVVGTAVTYGDLKKITPYRMDVGAPGWSRDVELATTDTDYFGSPGNMLLVDHPEPALAGLMYPTSVTHYLDGGRAVYSGKLLAGGEDLLPVNA